MKEKKKVFRISNFFKKYYKFIFLLIGIVGIAAMIISNDPANTDWSLFVEKKFLLLLLECFGVWIVIYILHTLTYKIILKDEAKKIDFPHLMKITVTGFALNNVTPAGLVGGEPYRIMELKKFVSTEKSASATFSFTILYAVGHLLLWDAGFIAYLSYGLPGSTAIDILMIATGTFNIVATFCLIFLRINMVCPVMKFLTKLPIIGKKLVPMYENNKQKYIEIDNLINEFRKDWFRFVLVLLIQFGTRLLEAFEYYIIILYFLNGAKDFAYIEGLMVMASCSLIGNLIFFVPMQTGTRESGLQISLNFLFEDSIASALFFPVGAVYRFREITCTMIGLIMVAATRRNKKLIKEVEKSEQQIAASEEKVDSEECENNDNKM